MVNEDSPLLVDPPIDDESYRHEASTMPSDEQKHIMYASYTLTISLSRFCEIISILLVALYFNSTLIPITVYSFLVLFASLFNERFVLSIVGSFRSKMNLMNAILIGNRLSVILFASFLLIRQWHSNWYYQLFIFAGLTLSTILLKLELILFQLTFRNDWLRVLSNSQQSVRVLFGKHMHAWSVIISLIFPVITGFLVSKLTINECAKFLIFSAILGLIIEASLFYRLYSTCYALHLPRSQFYVELNENFSIEAHPMIGVLTTPTISANTMGAFNYTLTSRPLSRILSYVKRKPVPIIVTVGVQLVKVSLITIGPHMVWFLLKSDVSPTFVGFAKMLQTLVTLHPTVSARRSFAFTVVGSVLAIVCLCGVRFWDVSGHWVIHLFAFFVILARSGVPTINLVGEQFVEDYLADDEVYRLYKENSSWLGTQCEMAVHILTILWSHKHQFIWPMSVSALLMIAGTTVIVKVIRYHFNNWSLREG